MVGLIETFGLGTVVIILLVGIAAIVSFIGWIKKLWRERESFRQANINAGRSAAQAEQAEESRFVSGESRIAQLELLVKQQGELLKEVKETNERLIRSDKLAIKTYIKEQHDTWVPKGCIDGQILELLEERFEIYKEEGGNSWAERLMKDLRALPVVVVIPNQEEH